MSKNFSRRTFIFSGAGATVLANTNIASASAINGSVETSKLQFSPNGKSEKKIRVAYISDIHLTGDETQEKPFDEALSIIQAEKPDLVLLGGDYILILDQLLSKATYGLACNRDWFKEDVGYKKNREHVRDIYRTVAEKMVATVGSTPIIATLGNHDNWHGPEICAEEFSKVNIQLLVNSSASLKVKDAQVFVYGTDDFGTGVTNTSLSQDADFKIFLSHNPDYFSIGDNLSDVSSYDLLLSGHSHGGQVVFPIIGAPFSNLYDVSHLSGWSKACGKPLYVSRGIGTSGIPIRYNCPPEAVIVDISC